LACLILKLPYGDVYGNANWTSVAFQKFDGQFRKGDAFPVANFFEETGRGQRVAVEMAR